LQDPALVPIYKNLPPLPLVDLLFSNELRLTYLFFKAGIGRFSPCTILLVSVAKILLPIPKGGGPSSVLGEAILRQCWLGLFIFFHLISIFPLMFVRCRNCIGAMLFTEADPNFINPARVNPIKLARQTTAGTTGNQRLLYNGRIAVCVSAVFCTESVVVTSGKISSKTDRTRKWISGIFHNQDWERFEAVMCLVFGEEVLYAQISPKKAIAFQSMISPDVASGSKGKPVTFLYLPDL
jgi:hypothetical protein